MDKDEFKKLLRSHLAAPEPECRWCFAIDMKRVKGKIVAQYSFPDGMVLHLSCPRCGGEFSFYSEGWREDYLKGLIFKLNPHLGGQIDPKLFNDINDRVFAQCKDA